MKITAIEPSARQPDRWHISLDGKYAFSLDGTTVLAEQLAVGRDLTSEEIDALRVTAGEQRAFDAALAFLGARPRSRAEVRRRLLRARPRGTPFSPEVVERVLARLERMNLLDDWQFASFWVEQRERFSPRAAYALTQELRQRGVAPEIAEESVDAEDDLARALAAGRQRLRLLSRVDYATFRTKLGGFLMRRGFAYGVAREAVRQLWAEAGGEQRGDADEDADDYLEEE